MSPIIRECERLSLDYFILHTGQHYSYEMDRAFFDQLELPEPKYNLDVGSGTHADQTGRIMSGIEAILMEEKPDIVLVQGDTNTVLAGALAATKLHIKVGHVEAGLRSYDRSMPEEINRVIADHISDYLFAPTEMARQNLLTEGIDDAKIFVTGNTVVDAVFQNLEIAKGRLDILKTFDIESKKYFLVTAHRQENVDNPEKLRRIFNALAIIHSKYKIPIVFPVHPRTKKMIVEFSIPQAGIFMIEPIGFLEFLHIESSARLILTDSGGVQEEACILNVPCVTLRENTERPETIEVGANRLVGTDTNRIIQGVQEMIDIQGGWKTPFGDGNAGKNIVTLCCELHRIHL